MTIPVKKIVLTVLVLLVSAFLGRTGLHWYDYGRYVEETDNAYIKSDSVAIRPEIAGRIEAIAVEENQRVNKGQLLVQLDASDYQAKVMQAQARLAVNQAALADAKAQLLLQAKTLDEADANIDAVRAELHRSALELQRFSALEKQSFNSKQQLQNAEAAVDVAKAKVAQATAAKAAALQMLEVLKVKINMQDAQILVAKSELEYAQNQLEKTAIVAPSDGIIGNLHVHAGSSAQPAMTLLYIVPLPNVYVVANYKETQITHMSIGQSVQLHVDSQPDVTYTGVVESLSPATGTEFSLLPNDNATGNFNKIVQRVPVRIKVTGPSKALALLRPGLSVIPAVDTRDFEQQTSYLANSENSNAVLARRTTP